MPIPDLLVAGAKRVDIVRVATADPGANAELSHTVPAGKLWELLGFFVVLVQGITQTPRPILVIDDGANVLQEYPLGFAVAASTTVALTWGHDLPRDAALIGTTPDSRAGCPMARDIVMKVGWRLRTVTLGIGANTNYGVGSILVAEYDL